MTKDKKPTQIKKDVMDKIKTSDVKMKPQQYYLLLTIAMIGAGFIFMALSALVISLLSHDDMVGRDLRSIGLNSSKDRTFSLLLGLVIVSAGVMGAYLVIKKFKIGYKNQSAIILALLLSVVIMLSLLVVQTGMASNISTKPPFKPLTPYSSDFKENHVRGEVESINDEGVKVFLKREQKTVTILINDKTKVVGNLDIKPGAVIIAKGEYVDKDTFSAEIISYAPYGKKFQYYQSSYKNDGIKKPRAL